MGTRLGELSDELPKPLLPVVDQPILRYGLALLAGHGIAEVTINLHHHSGLIVEELTVRPSGVAITWSHEPEILGTGGGIRRMADWLTQGDQMPCLVLNGKVIADVDLHALVARHRESGALATLVVREVADAARWGAIDLDENDRVVEFLGEGHHARLARRTMFTGIQILSPELITGLPDGASCILRQGLIPALARGARIMALRYDGYFAEHSTPGRYLAGNWALLEGRAKLRFLPGKTHGIDETAAVAAGARLVAPYFIGAGARVEGGATVGPYAVVGQKARVTADAQLAHTVVWAGACAAGKLSHAIVTLRNVHRVARD